MPRRSKRDPLAWIVNLAADRGWPLQAVMAGGKDTGE